MQQPQQQGKSRTKERYVWEAQDLVTRWRQKIYDEGVVGENGRKHRVTLDQAAEIVGCPRKSLEDYYYLLRKAATMINLDEKRQEKMGYIRKLCRDQKKQQQQQGQESDVKMEEEDLEERFAPEN